MPSPLRSLLAAGLLVLAAQPAHATLFTATSGTRAASADFSVVNNQLQVVLANTSSADAKKPTDVLTAVFFSIASDPAFTSISAVLGAGSSVIYGPQPAGGVVGGEWAYGNNLAGAPGGANQGISSSGLGLFGSGTFPGSNLAGPPSGAVGGLQYGLTTAGDDPSTGNTGLTKSPLIKNAVVFTLGNVPLNFDPGQSIYDVSFQYGTGLTEPNVVASCGNCGGPPPGGGGSHSTVPEPASFALLASALALLLVPSLIGRRRRG